MTTFLFLLLSSVSFAGPLNLPANSPAEQLLQQMSLDEKISYVGGTGFATAEIPRLNIPALQMSDGPMGVRFGDGTAWPAGIALSATFDKKLAKNVGVALGQEAQAFDRHLLLGPMINMARVPWGGRVFESFGEDPYLAGQFAREYIQGLQSQGVGACVKHFAANNQEWYRSSYNANISGRALQEIYLPAFKAAVDAGSISIMASYNQVNGAFSAENSTLLQSILKTDWGFQGFVVSDWGATHSTIPSALAGLDLEMPVASYFSDNLKQAVLSGDVPMDVLDDKVRRILYGMERLGLLSNPVAPVTAVKSHPDLSLKVAEESLVLLKNKKQALPLPTNRHIKVALLGPSLSVARTGGGGSSYVYPSNPISALTGITNLRDKLGASIDFVTDDQQYLLGDSLPHPPILFSPSGEMGLQADYYGNESFLGSPTFTRVDSVIDFDWVWGTPDPSLDGSSKYSVRWSGKLIARTSGPHEFILGHNEGVRLFVDDKLMLDRWQITQNPAISEDRFTLNLNANEEHNFKIEYYKDNGLAYVQLGIVEPGAVLDKAKTLAQSADYAVVFVGNSAKGESESFDRTSLRLTPEQESLIQEVSAVNPNTIVVIQAGSAIEMREWIDSVAGVLFAWFPGDQGGTAIANVLFGQVSPSGRLPLSFPNKWEDSSVASSYPGIDGQVDYTDDILIGYRHFDTHSVAPLYRFGYGLSYSHFISKITHVTSQTSATSPSADIEVEVKNMGPVNADYVIPVYVSDLHPKVPKALRELKAFERVSLKVGEKQKVKLHLGADAFHYFNPMTNKWQTDPGEYKLEIFSEKSQPVDSRNLNLL